MLSIRRNGELKRQEEHNQALTTMATCFYEYIAYFLKYSTKINIEPELHLWKEEVQRKNASLPERVVGQLFTTDCPEIVARRLYDDRQFEKYQIHMAEAANPSGGIDKKTEKYIFRIEDQKPLGLGTYQNLSARLQEEFPEIEETDNGLISYAVFKMYEPASRFPLLIESGNPPKIIESPIKRIGKKVLSSTIPLKILRRKNVINLSRESPF